MSLSEVTLYARHFARALIDSNESESLLICEEISSVGRFALMGNVLRSHEEGRAILDEKPRIDSRRLDRAHLRALPAGTLGHEYVAHLDRLELDPDLLAIPVTRGATPEANYLLERERQTHDIWHVLVGLGALPHEEVLLAAFTWAQLGMIHSGLITVLGSIKHLVLERRWPLLRHGVRAAIEAGKRAAPLLPVYWERRWDQPLEALRRELDVVPAAQWRGVAWDRTATA